MQRALLERKLNDNHQRLARARVELAIVDEQLEAVVAAADETRLKALVAETPQSERESAEAARHVTVMQRTRDDLVAQIASLEKTQDDIIDRLVLAAKF